eukprot:TRINITY_DN51574_c0_g1_i1.p1 TRINITY_DN51574_c0_g1~~TRINITY_DN51574_c0_g1_i1.p1  ORF type:complete len:406 (+),score=86.80 TRINITY_DN51574_c0_g1_i1:51-1220(+)
MSRHCCAAVRAGRVVVRRVAMVRRCRVLALLATCAVFVAQVFVERSRYAFIAPRPTSEAIRPPSLGLRDSAPAGDSALKTGLAVAVPAGVALALAAPAAAQTLQVVTSQPDLSAVWAKAAGSAAKGGAAGFLAGVAQVMTFMWLRTSMNYQYFNGGSLQDALSTLWKEGGIQRLYQGFSLAVIQAPLSRFGDTAANAGILVLMDFYLPEVPIAVKTAFASTAAATWRVFLTPIDTLKTAKQVRGDDAVGVLLERVRRKGPGELYAGAIANFAANWAGNYPYFFVFNSLSEAWLAPEDATAKIVRNGVLGMCSSIASDIVSNSLRVLKTLRQGADADSEKGYVEAAKEIIEKDGIAGLLGRGLETRLLTNVLQGTFFTIVWKLAEEALNK